MNNVQVHTEPHVTEKLTKFRDFFFRTVNDEATCRSNVKVVIAKKKVHRTT